MKSPRVQEVCLLLWDRREAGDLTPLNVGELSRALIIASADDVEQDESYEPNADQRLRWALGVFDAVRAREPNLKASGDLEAMAAFLLERQEAVVISGKDLAAGMSTFVDP